MNNKTLFGIIAGILLLLGGTVWLAGTMSTSADVETAEGVAVEVADTAWDWGEIGIDDGKVEKEFEIKNTGSQTLKLFNIATSCMCTTAQFMGDGQSPIFGMHTKSGYVKEVSAGESTRLKVVFDPMFHGPDGIGPISRQITMMTNDPDSGQLNLMVTAVVRR